MVMSLTLNDGPRRCDPVRRSMRRSIHGPPAGAFPVAASTYTLFIAGSITWLAIRSATPRRSSLRSGHGAGFALPCSRGDTGEPECDALALSGSGPVGDTGAPRCTGADLARCCPWPAAVVVLEHPAPATEANAAIAI